MIEVIIDRTTWQHGEGGTNSALRLNNGKQCCLGFLCKTMGFTDEEILNKGMPRELNAFIPGMAIRVHKWAPFIGVKDRLLVQEMASTNDAVWIPDWWREMKLRRLAHLAGYEFTFIG